MFFNIRFKDFNLDKMGTNSDTIRKRRSRCVSLPLGSNIIIYVVLRTDIQQMSYFYLNEHITKVRRCNVNIVSCT
jgi:hypothetical protein